MGGPPPLDFGHSRMWGARQIWSQPRQRYLSRLARMRSISTCTSMSQVSVARSAPSPIFCSSLRAEGERAAPNLGGGSIPGIGMESAQFPSSSQGPKFVLSAVEGQPSDALSVSGVITNVGELTAARPRPLRRRRARVPLQLFPVFLAMRVGKECPHYPPRVCISR